MSSIVVYKCEVWEVGSHMGLTFPGVPRRKVLNNSQSR